MPVVRLLFKRDLYFGHIHDWNTRSSLEESLKVCFDPPPTSTPEKPGTGLSQKTAVTTHEKINWKGIVLTIPDV
jgi:hypothetical protein